MNIAIRVDGNKKLGMGNLYRSVELAIELQKISQNVYFITKSWPEAISFLQNKKLPFFLLTSSIYSFSQEKEISEIIKNHNIQMLINDIKDTDEAYMQFLKNLKISIVNFDDLGNGREYADILFDAFYKPKIPSKKTSENYGPDYLILRKEFQSSSNRIPFKKVNSITVIMGAANTGNFLEKVLKALSMLPDDIQFHVILSQAIEKANIFQLDFNKKNFTFYYQPENISEIFLNSDLAITAGGLSMCETCALGTPTLVIPQVPHELENAKLFASKGAVSTLNYDPDITKEQIFNQLVKLISNHRKRNKLAQNSQKLIDGKGIERVIKALKPYLV